MDSNLDFVQVAKIKVIGVGGGGCNAVARMAKEGVRGVDFYVANTDAQILKGIEIDNKIILGRELTHGLGAGGNPEVGRKAALETEEEIREALSGANMVFIAAGMGGGTGTGGAPIVAKAAKDKGILTVAIVTRPFSFEGKEKMSIAIEGINELKKVVDSIIIVSNDKLLMYESNSSVQAAFKKADSVLASSVRTITDIIMTPYLMNLDFADLKRALKNSGVALIGYGIGSGVDKCSQAVENAVNNPLLETTISGARNVLCGISMGPNVSMNDVMLCINKISALAGNELDLKFAFTTNPELSDDIVISLVASNYPNSDEIINNGNKQLENNIINNFTNIQNNINSSNEVSKDNDQGEDSQENKEEDYIPKFLEEDGDDSLF